MGEDRRPNVAGSYDLETPEPAPSSRDRVADAKQDAADRAADRDVTDPDADLDEPGASDRSR